MKCITNSKQLCILQHYFKDRDFEFVYTVYTKYLLLILVLVRHIRLHLITCNRCVISAFCCGVIGDACWVDCTHNWCKLTYAVPSKNIKLTLYLQSSCIILLTRCVHLLNLYSLVDLFRMNQWLLTVGMNIISTCLRYSFMFIWNSIVLDMAHLFLN